MHFKRLINIKSNSPAFLFGPRMTGKSTLLKSLSHSEYFDLLDPSVEIQYKSRPELFWEQISSLPPKSVIIVDEIQKAPNLLNYVQMAIDRFEHIYILSGSSARKLKRGGANLLGGRALDLKLHPLTCEEIGPEFHLEGALLFGTLPKIQALLHTRDNELAKGHLKSYVTTYIKEEIQAEALTRNIGSFQRFLEVAAQSNAQVIEYSNISRECSVPASTVKEYYQILEDTLLGFLLWPYGHNERKKSRPKSYFFDCGIVRSIQGRLDSAPTPQETGFLFETWMLNELIKVRDYLGKSHTFSFWRERDHEIDILIMQGTTPILAIECKSGKSDPKRSTILRFSETFPDVPLIVASLTDSRPRNVNNTSVLPWRQVIERYKNL